MPANASLAISHQMDRWQFLGDYTWTGWSSVDTVKLKNKQTGAQISTLPFNFQDTYRVGFGVNYQYNDTVKTRFGVAYDKAPVKSAVDRTMTLPDSDRTWLSFGVKYGLSKISSLDIGYSHIFFKDARTARPDQLRLGTSCRPSTASGTTTAPTCFRRPTTTPSEPAPAQHRRRLRAPFFMSATEGADGIPVWGMCAPTLRTRLLFETRPPEARER